MIAYKIPPKMRYFSVHDNAVSLLVFRLQNTINTFWFYIHLLYTLCTLCVLKITFFWTFENGNFSIDIELKSNRFNIKINSF